MSEYRLERKTALNLDAPVDEAWDGFAMAELSDRYFYWLATGMSGVDGLSRAVKKATGADLPDTGRMATGTLGGRDVTIAWLAPGQWCLRGSGRANLAPIEKHCCVTDQSDGWVGLSVEGSRAREVLARLCALDLHPETFAEGHVARTPFEGMHCQIACVDTKAGRYALYFQRSVARCFVDHLRHAARSVCGDRIASPG